MVEDPHSYQSAECEDDGGSGTPGASHLVMDAYHKNHLQSTFRRSCWGAHRLDARAVDRVVANGRVPGLLVLLVGDREDRMIASVVVAMGCCRLFHGYLGPCYPLRPVRKASLPAGHLLGHMYYFPRSTVRNERFV